MRVCPYCGSQMADDDPFCYKCGAMVQKPKDVPPQGNQQPNYQQQQQQSYQQQPNYQQQSPYYSGRGGPKKNNWLPVLIVTAIILLAAFAGVSLLSNMISDDSSGSDHTMEYKWDFYTDDTNYNTYTYKLTVPADYYSKMRSSTIDRTGTSSDVHLSTSQGTVYAVNEYIVVDKYITQVSKDLRDLYTSEKNASKIPSTTDLSSFIMAFVQGSITYQTDSDYTGGSYTEYWKYPLETLCDKKGDCEDTSILMAALLDAAYTSSNDASCYNAGIFLLPGHAMCAVKVTDVSESRHGDTIRFDYYPLESTSDNNKKYTVGTISSEYEGDYFHLYTGHATSYYGVTVS